jgi:hypothetical protein
MMKTIAGAMLAAGLCLAACGGAEQGPDEKAMISAAPKTAVEAKAAAAMVPATTVRCSNEEWQDIFWSDVTYTTQVGTLACLQCGGFETRAGVTSNFITLDFEFVCSNE